ncbi:RING finger domain-containing protein [Endozoicomonas sp. GU-1]|uniref:RING finger domain-containing protein n=1 Tax=Endozoicomonas sp. GU-1 TaxID=3009078 RepID=UPI0022B2DC18|nr:RING finger domain-containing protein [Endozoicomonas sp. GU-1]WBA86102.1 hypothetical protein O3276_23330 [Endozoicomonas sp. GU-1]
MFRPLQQSYPLPPPNCPICHGDLYRPENPEFAGRYVATARPCGHKFHFKCLDRWRKDHLECPYGRRAIEDMVLENRTLPRGWQQQMTNAAKQGDIGIIRVLLNLGADVDAGQSPGKTPLALAATNKHLDAALLLADRGGGRPGRSETTGAFVPVWWRGRSGRSAQSGVLVH